MSSFISKDGQSVCYIRLQGDFHSATRTHARTVARTHAHTHTHTMILLCSLQYFILYFSFSCFHKSAPLFFLLMTPHFPSPLLSTARLLSPLLYSTLLSLLLSSSFLSPLLYSTLLYLCISPLLSSAFSPSLPTSPSSFRLIHLSLPCTFHYISSLSQHAATLISRPLSLSLSLSLSLCVSISLSLCQSLSSSIFLSLFLSLSISVNVSLPQSLSLSLFLSLSTHSV